MSKGKDRGQKEGRTEAAGTEVSGGAEEHGLEWFAGQRGISLKVLDAAGIGRESDGRYRGWWRIPFPHRSGIWKTRYRNPDPGRYPKYLDGDHAQFHLYNPLELGPGEEEVWFCEGEFDTLSMIDQGYRAVGIHGAANVAQPPQKEESEEEEEEEEREWTGKFLEEWRYLFEDTTVFVVFDNDATGRYAGRELARFLDGDAFDAWDDDYGDIGEWHKDHPVGLARALAGFRTGILDGTGMG